MNNPFLFSPARIMKVTTETPDIKTFRIEFVDESQKSSFLHQPGQFVEVSIPGVGECPISISSSPTRSPGFELSIKKVGKVTEAIHELGDGDILGIRGPYGRGFPYGEFAGKNLLFIGGGIGLAPLRSLLQIVLDRRGEYGNIMLIYGARSPQDLVFKEELRVWGESPEIDVCLTVDKGDEEWKGNVGFVPAFLNMIGPSSDGTIALLCGPPIMIRFVLQDLASMGFTNDVIVTTLEMKMKCGIGLCGRCMIGSRYVCLDGPVFTLEEILRFSPDLSVLK